MSCAPLAFYYIFICSSVHCLLILLSFLLYLLFTCFHRFLSSSTSCTSFACFAYLVHFHHTFVFLEFCRFSFHRYASHMPAFTFCCHAHAHASLSSVRFIFCTYRSIVKSTSMTPTFICRRPAHEPGSCSACCGNNVPAVLWVWAFPQLALL